LLLRHGEVASHRGDVPVTEAGIGYATDVGRRIGRTYKSIRLMHGETMRTQQTAAAIAAGARESGAVVTELGATHALRNPDIYVAGQRVNMVSDAAALAAQISDLSVEEAARVPFFEQFFAADDRIKYWLNCESPSGETTSMVASRLNDFAKSFQDKDMTAAVIIGVTHSPIIRSVALTYLGADPGEPNWIAGVEANICADRVVTWRSLTDPMTICSAESVAENR
jgi:broad specificity phosphatase PhoE